MEFWSMEVEMRDGIKRFIEVAHYHGHIFRVWIGMGTFIERCSVGTNFLVPVI